MCIYKDLITWIQINHQIKSTLNSRKSIKKTPNIVHTKYNTFTVVYHLLMIVILQIMTVYNQYITIQPLLMTIHHC